MVYIPVAVITPEVLVQIVVVVNIFPCYLAVARSTGQELRFLFAEHMDIGIRNAGMTACTRRMTMNRFRKLGGEPVIVVAACAIDRACTHGF
jgi:hypothetical protein